MENIWIMKIVSAEKKLIDKLIGECNGNIRKNEMIYNNNLNDYKSCDVGEYLDYKNCKCRKN